MSTPEATPPAKQSRTDAPTPIPLPRTDLACEASPTAAPSTAGYESTSYRRDCVSVTRVSVTDKETAALLGRSVGTYVTVHAGQISPYTPERARLLTEILSAELRRLAERTLGEPIRRSHRVLVVGLGNAHMTPDALGPETVGQIEVTDVDPDADTAAPRPPSATVAAIAPGVRTETGIDSSALCKSVAEAFKADLIVAVDALAARNRKRLLATVQITDTGIRPGSGIGARTDALSKETVGRPVLAIGVPTVADSSALVYDALKQAGITEGEIRPELRSILENGTGYFVSPKDLDVYVPFYAERIAEAIGIALRTERPGETRGSIDF